MTTAALHTIAAHMRQQKKTCLVFLSPDEAKSLKLPTNMRLVLLTGPKGRAVYGGRMYRATWGRRTELADTCPSCDRADCTTLVKSTATTPEVADGIAKANDLLRDMGSISMQLKELFAARIDQERDLPSLVRPVRATAATATVAVAEEEKKKEQKPKSSSKKKPATEKQACAQLTKLAAQRWAEKTHDRWCTPRVVRHATRVDGGGDGDWVEDDVSHVGSCVCKCGIACHGSCWDLRCAGGQKNCPWISLYNNAVVPPAAATATAVEPNSSFLLELVGGVL